jgi:excisionase family DNA binding protein
MNAELFAQLHEDVAQSLAKRAMEIIAEQKFKPEPDPLLNTEEIAAELNISKSKTRELVATGHLRRAKGITDIRVRKSVVDAYGTK